jgi:hypothetical protein
VLIWCAAVGNTILADRVINRDALILYVSSTHALASDHNDGTSPDAPLATIAAAVALCTANRGDTIYVAPGHAETVVAAGGNIGTEATAEEKKGGVFSKFFKGLIDKKLFGMENIDLISDRSLKEWEADIGRLKRRFPANVVIAGIMASCESDWQEAAGCAR